MPWCPRCGTGLSEHEIVTEGYIEVKHISVYVKFPLVERPGESLLVWTTTPWTLPGNVAAAVHPELTYVKVRQGDDVLYVSKGAVASAVRGEHEVVGEVPGAELVGLTYRGPFDELPAAAGRRRIASSRGRTCRDAEGTGIVHIAPGCGKEDFASQQGARPRRDRAGRTTRASTSTASARCTASSSPRRRRATRSSTSLRAKGVLYRTQSYAHRYPHCWRCSTELSSGSSTSGSSAWTSFGIRSPT